MSHGSYHCAVRVESNRNKDWINIGTEKCCVFVRMSKRLLYILKTYPLLHRAIEEGVISAERNKYYAAGILAFSQILNILNDPTPEDRHAVAHKFLEIIPQEASYRKIAKMVKIKLEEIGNKELKKSVDKIKYFEELQKLWREIYKKQKSNIG
ncbi:MAG: hypothetical protein PHF45_01675 [Candidatus Pacebacteria bacterium]|nr:hypothetical protein [Candidatus Paceibacterota bacterium]